MKRFFFSFMVALTIFAGVCAMVWADISSRGISGGDSSLFSYEIESQSVGKLELFGKPYYVDRTRLLAAGSSFNGFIGSCLDAAESITPSFISDFAAALSNGFSGLADDLYFASDNGSETSDSSIPMPEGAVLS